MLLINLFSVKKISHSVEGLHVFVTFHGCGLIRVLLTLSKGLFSDADRDGSDAEEFRDRILLEDGLEDFLLMRKVDEHADVASAVSHSPFGQLSHILHILGPGLGHFEHLFGEVECGTGDS